MSDLSQEELRVLHYFTPTIVVVGQEAHTKATGRAALSAVKEWYVALLGDMGCHPCGWRGCNE